MKKECDCCHKVRGQITSMGRDDNGDPDAPDMCFICIKEGERGKVFDLKQNRYVYPEDVM